MVKVFISHPTPYNRYQEQFLKLIKDKLLEYNLEPVNLGTSNFDFEKPLKPIKELMLECKGAIIVGIERHHGYIGFDKEYSKDQKELVHKYTSSPWIHIEGGMAYQAGIPLLILKEVKIHAEGILDPNNSESYVYNFEIKKNIKKLSDSMNKMIESWVKKVSS